MKIGRPRVPKESRRSVYRAFKVTQEEDERIRAFSKAAGMDDSKWIRSKLLNMKSKITSRGRGRPKSKDPRTICVLIHLTSGESDIIAKKATRMKIPKAKFIREAAIACAN